MTSSRPAGGPQYLSATGLSRLQTVGCAAHRHGPAPTVNGYPGAGGAAMCLKDAPDLSSYESQTLRWSFRPSELERHWQAVHIRMARCTWRPVSLGPPSTMSPASN